MSTPLTIAQKNNLPIINEDTLIVEIGNNGTPGSLTTALVSAGAPGNIRSLLISNDHASEVCYLSTKSKRSGVSRGIRLDPGDAIFLATSGGYPPAADDLEFGGAGTVTLSVACFY